MLTVTVPAPDPDLIDIASLRVIAGYAADDTSHDDDLEALSSRLTADICVACRIAIVAGAAPTLRRETLVQTFRRPASMRLVLSRRHDVSVSSVIIDGVALASDEYEVAPESGLLSRVDSGCLQRWRGIDVAVTFQAGFADVPADLAGAVADLARYRLSEASRDPLVKSESVEVKDVEVRAVSYWVGSLPGAAPSSSLPSDIASRLSRYMNVRLS
jgi:hypothetical protein